MNCFPGTVHDIPCPCNVLGFVGVLIVVVVTEVMVVVEMVSSACEVPCEVPGTGVVVIVVVSFASGEANVKCLGDRGLSAGLVL